MIESSLITPSRPWIRLFATNQTATSITTPTPTTTAPTGTNVIDLTGSSPMSCIAVAFFGAGSDNNTARARITGWKHCALTGSTTLWVPTPLSALSLTLCTMVGVAGAAAVATDRFVDTITESTAYTTAKEIVIAGAGTPSADNTLAIIKIDTFGHEYIQVDVDTNSSATNINGIWTGY